MNIQRITCTPTFMATLSADSSILPEQDFINLIHSGKEIDFSKINEKTKKTLFQCVVDANYVNLVMLLWLKRKDLSYVINIPDPNGKMPLDTASQLMQALLRRVGAKSSAECPIIAQKDDAKVIAAKVFMTNPIKSVPTTSTGQTQTAQTKQTAETAQTANPSNVNYFDIFEEVNDDVPPASEERQVAVVENRLPVLVKNNTLATIEPPINTQQAVDLAPQEENTKPMPKELNLECIKDFKRLEITPNDVLFINDLIGRDEIKRELTTNVIAPFKDKDILQKLKINNIDLPNGILFSGNGGGELTIIKALSNETEIPVILMEQPSELEQIITAIKARYKKTGLKTIILAQGFDQYFSNCSTCDRTNANTFRNKIRGIRNNGGLFIATATDRTKISKDLLQSGIIDKVFDVPKPNEDDRKRFITRYFNEKEIFNDIKDATHIDEMVNLTDNCTYADIIRILDETSRTAAANGKNADMDIFRDQLKDFSKDLDIVPITDENRTAAYDTDNFKRVPIKQGEMMSLDELGGMPEAIQRLRELYVEPMKNLEELTKIFGTDAIPDGAIFYGTAGNGKTMTARVLARELKLPFYETRLSDFGTAAVHESGKKFKIFADQLENKFKKTGERSVWFLDEFEGMGASRNKDQVDNELTDALLQELNNPADRGFILIAATNNLEDVDAALKRRGRLGNWIEFTNPNFEERKDMIQKELLKHEFTKEFISDDELVTYLAKEFDGFSRACIANIVKDAKRDFYINKIDFKIAIKKAIDINAQREMGEFCDKAGLTQFKYEDLSYKSLDELGGMSEVIKQLKEHVIDAWNPEIRKALIANKRMPSGGFILEGPPGGGKTTIIETLAREMDVPLYKMNYNQEGNEFIHRVTKVIQEIFDRLALISKILKKPVMLFFDESEKFFPQYAERHQIEEVNTYKDLMNTAAARGIILAGATNYIDRVNHEITGNPRRMGKIIHCGNPNLNDRIDLSKKLLKDLPIISGDFTEEDFTDIATFTDGLSIGKIAAAIDDIIVQAVKSKKNITPKEIVNKFQRVVPKQLK